VLWRRGHQGVDDQKTRPCGLRLLPVEARQSAMLTVGEILLIALAAALVLLVRSLPPHCSD